MARYSGLGTAPAFCPIVADFYSGMEVTVPLFAGAIRGSAADIAEAYRKAYPADGIVRFADADGEDGFLAANALEGSDAMRVSIHGNDERILLVARYDNLGKGASGAAIQNMNLVLGSPEQTGLVI
jgi:N-acetyl-gamma-glutamyl-phosphate reductase